MTGWRVFIGLWDDPEAVTHLDITGIGWEEGRAVLDARFVGWRTDSCPDCVAQAGAEHSRLRSLPSGREFAGEVEGEQYLLIRADRVDEEDLGELWAAAALGVEA